MTNAIATAGAREGASGSTGAGEGPREGVRETLESIVIALILAFVFRAFIVEAFVIPTGSMAPTLYGAHGTIVCEDCGTEFAYGLRDLADGRAMPLVNSQSYATCPNCHHINTDLKINDERRNPETGDRILVLKWPFDLGLAGLGPERWDVIVFKDPADGVTNFIKRMVGLPNEVLMIVDGDVYTVGVEELSEATREELDRNRHEKYLFQSGQQRGQLAGVSRPVREELEQKMRIARKSEMAQRALWHVVYDHNYPPRQLDANQPRWQPLRREGSGWDATSVRVRFTDRGNADDAIVLTGKPILAYNAYNIHGRQPPPVSDLRVRFVLTPAKDTGELLIRLEKLGRTFWARLSMDGEVRLVESRERPGSEAPVMAAGRTEALAAGRPVEVSVENLDYRLAVRVGGREVVASTSDRDAASYYGPDLRMLSRMRQPMAAVPPRIYARGGEFELTHLAVDRDEYYYHDPSFQALALSWGPRDGWATPEYPMLLRGHEFFMLGDNTSASKDSRLWDQIGSHLVSRGEDFQLGTVPEDQLIGKAFFVYWPSPVRVDWLPFLNMGVVPDVGRMRWIR